MQETTQGTPINGQRVPVIRAGQPPVCFYIDSTIVSTVAHRWAMDVIAAAAELTDDVRTLVEQDLRRRFNYVQELDIEVRTPETLAEVLKPEDGFLRAFLCVLDAGAPMADALCALQGASFENQGGGVLVHLPGPATAAQKIALRRVQGALQAWLGGTVEVTTLTPPSEAPPPAPEEAPPADRAPRGKGRPRRRRLDQLITQAVIPMADLTETSGHVALEGEIFALKTQHTKNGRDLYTFDITDRTGSVTAKLFAPDGAEGQGLPERLAQGQYVRVLGEWVYDDFSREMTLRVRALNPADAPRILDDADEKRIELHLHTQMSALDSVVPVEAAVKKAAGWGHKAIAITDHGVVQSFPEAAEAGKKAGIKVILGMEGYMISPRAGVVRGGGTGPLSQPFIVVDIETTGLNPEKDRITEIAAVRLEDGRQTDTFQTLVNPGVAIPGNIAHLTGITNEMVEGAPDIEAALGAFAGFAGSCAIVAHNAPFDMGFLRAAGRRCGLRFDQPVVDTLALARALYPGHRSYRLDRLCAKLGVKLTGHHRALQDAAATAGILAVMLADLGRKGVQAMEQVNATLAEGADAGERSVHVVLLVKNRTGLKNLYKLVSESHMKYLHKGKPRLPRSLIAAHREGLVIGSACEAGEVFQAVLQGEDEGALREMADFYDYLELQPLGNNAFMVREGAVAGNQDLIRINRRILALGKTLNKPVVATGDVHFLNPEDEVYRRILMSGQKYEDADTQPPLYLRTTGQMMDEFFYLDDEDRRAVVIDGPHEVASWVEDVDPLPPYKLYAPHVEGAQDDIVNMSHRRALEIYGDPLPEVVATRLQKELNAITTYNFSVLYLVAHRLVKKSLDDGYLVGSRGSVGSSLVAFLCDITEVNPLQPHYVCPACRASDFTIDGVRYPCGADLPERDCPACGARMAKTGFDIPFEVFLGFDGDKVPDIDLNFSGDYQSVAHEYTEVLFGKGNVFRAGTIGTIAAKTAYGFVKNYLEERGRTATRAEVDRLVNGCVGVKRTTGQHPGGIVVVPGEYEVTDFCPIQYPADEAESGIVTTHFTFDSLHDRLVKLDILGHDDPTVLRMLQDLTGVDPKTLPLNDPDTLEIFHSTRSLGYDGADMGGPNGAYGIPEFGTPFVRQMLEETAPTTIAELIRISGLSHGTNVWVNNARDLVADGTATLLEVICTREDIMASLIARGVNYKIAFDTMERVRKGKGLTPEMETAMAEANVPDWFVESCRKISYMFPKAHAAAYVTMALRIAWYKVHRPKAFYAAYFTVRADDFDAGTMLGGVEALKKELARVTAIEKPKPKDKNIAVILEVALEMNLRGIAFEAIDLYRSDAETFQITDRGIRPPLTALPGLGGAAARSLVEARAGGRFISVEQMQKKAHVSRAVVDILRQFHCIDDLPDTDQISLFDLV